ncbi:LysM peptidoglycan-binding domain-containing protein [Modestobacter sp. Leaf380]|uniref:LysM peptidoglycan-binding domain-containing protein n=1 Tax=Modestobacter sp. Leaf380 TaxID=1736356 RepID=UPI0009E7E451|nr:LysM peptidoglycan-binding domain-containing protein [Modestobacter sp. Leaf380]
MATTQRSTPSPRGNHPAGRALLAAGDRPGGVRAVGSARAAGESPVELPEQAAPGGAPGTGERLAEVLPFPVRRSDRGSRSSVEHEPVAPLRLTRRGRRVVAGLVLVGGLGLAALLGPAVVGPQGPGLALAGESSVVVQPGDTLWSIASAIAPDEDPRGVVDALWAANDLEGAGLVPGQVLLVP